MSPSASGKSPSLAAASARMATKPASPGRPKDLGKRAAILEAAKRLFTTQGYAGVSMDQIAAEAGVSKLTVYSHFGDKEALFAAAVKAHCERQLPAALFDEAAAAPLHDGLMQVARAFFAMITGPEALAGHRIMCSPQVVDTPIPRLFWEAGPRRVQDAFAQLLQRHVDAGLLDIDDVPRASAQFFALLKGEPHARMVFGCCEGAPDAATVERHLQASVGFFLRAYVAPSAATPAVAAPARARSRR
jgi:TetR/AcrR family transcriptional regulator, mexJK operon transcriptional repressor